MNHQKMSRMLRKRVVIVDDSRTMQAILDQILSSRAGLDIVGVASDATSAVSLIRTLRPDLVTIDLRMPYIDGCTLLELLADLTDVRKVIVSAHVSNNVALVTRLEDAGADACIDKAELSVAPDKFCSKIMGVLTKPKPANSRGALISCKEPSPVLMTNCAADSFPIPLDEHERLVALSRLDLANDTLDAQLDLLTTHLGKTTDFPACVMTFIDREHQWVKSAYGFARGSTPRAIAFCNYTLCADDAFVVTNAATDPRFAHNPLVTDEPRIRTYVGAPILTDAGVRLGALCLIDIKPRRVTPELVKNLSGIAGIAAAMIANRRSATALAA